MEQTPEAHYRKPESLEIGEEIDGKIWYRSMSCKRRFTGMLKLQDVAPLQMTTPPYSSNGMYYRLEILPECSYGDY